MQSQVCKKYTLSTERSQIFQIQDEVMKMRQKDIPRDLRKKSLNSSVSSVSSFDLKKSFRWLITNWKHFSLNFSVIIDICTVVASCFQQMAASAFNRKKWLPVSNF